MADTKKTIVELQRLMEPEGQDDLKKAELPELGEVLYVEPAPGGVRRNCSNCLLWSSSTERCAIHENGIEVTADHVCGYHLAGAPAKQWKDLSGSQRVQPKFSGLTLVKGGTACDGCQHFTTLEEEDGVCAAVVKRGKPAHVHPRSCCTRWSRKQTPVDPKSP